MLQVLPPKGPEEVIPNCKQRIPRPCWPWDTFSGKLDVAAVISWHQSDHSSLQHNPPRPVLNQWPLGKEVSVTPRVGGREQHGVEVTASHELSPGRCLGVSVGAVWWAGGAGDAHQEC